MSAHACGGVTRATVQTVRTRVVKVVDGSAALASIAVYGGLQLGHGAQLELLALVRIQVLHVLGAQSERGARDRTGQVEALGDLAPQLLVDHLDETAFVDH